jgi:hypothetical protein
MKTEQQKRLQEMGLLLPVEDGFSYVLSSPPEMIKLIRVPADDQEQLSELLFQPDAGSDPLRLQLDSYFAIYEDESVDMELIRQQVLPAYDKGCVGGMCPHVSFQTLEQHAAAGNLETLDLKDSSIRLYFDDSAAVKGRPLNHRASDYTKGERAVYGDAFMVRIRSNGSGYESLTAFEARQLLES